MTGAEHRRPDQRKSGRREPAAGPDALPPDAVGCWVVRTRRTTHLFDLDDAVYARVPGPGRRAMDHDRTWLRLLRFGVRPSVGTSFLIFVDDPDPVVAMSWEVWRVSSTVVSIEVSTRDRLDRLRTAELAVGGT